MVFTVVLVCVLLLGLFLGNLLLPLKTAPKTQAIGLGEVAQYSMDELLTSSTLVIEGELEGQTKPFEVKGQNGESDIYTDYFFKVNALLRGEEKSEIVTVRRPGGVCGDTEYASEYDIGFRYGKKYLLCLYKVNYGSGTNTKGDYYAVQGVYQGAFEEILPSQLQGVSLSENSRQAERYFGNCRFLFGEQAETAAFSLEQSQKIAEAVHEAEADGGCNKDILSYSLLSRELEELNEEAPVNENFTREQIEENLRANVEAGLMSREEYDFVTASLDRYGEIVSEYVVLNRDGVVTG